ncbi:MAG: shikimate dehydrogenase [Dehalococcoidia bacterium]
MANATTGKVGLIGYPIGHSMSPVLQQAGFDHLGLDIRYELWQTEPDYLPQAIDAIASPDVLGANVTAPFKEKVLPLLDELNEIASEIGAVNTVVKRDGRLVGFNTDAEGFLRSLEVEGKFDPGGKAVTLIGAGGVARAIGFALIHADIGSLTIVNRSPERAERLAAELGFADLKVVRVGAEDAYRAAVWNADLLVNCTSVGMKHGPAEGQSPINGNLISPDSFVYDVVYNPVKTPLINVAEEAGARALGGLSMLVYQGVASFELWTGQKAPVDIMMRAVREAL